MSNVKIVSEGSPQTTRVLVDNKQMLGVTKIEISPISTSGDLVEAKITVELSTLDIDVGTPNINLDNN